MRRLEPNGEIQLNAPYQWANLPTADTSIYETVDYVVAKLNGKDAIWAGDPTMHARRRSFIMVNETSEPPAPGTAELAASLDQAAARRPRQHGAPSALEYTLDLTTLPTQAATIAEKLKSSGATSVIFAGDPIMPIYLTKACADIGYFPEWIITGIVLTDTSTLGRYYDQAEWSHAFGVTSLGVPVPVASGDADRLYRWWYGPNTSPASLAAPATHPALPEQFFEGVQLAGPDLTPSTFTTGLFRAPPAGGGPDVAALCLRLPGRGAAAQLLVARRLHVLVVRRHGQRPRRGGRRRHRSHALRQRREALQGGRGARRSGPDVLAAGVGDQLRVAPGLGAVLPGLARVARRVGVGTRQSAEPRRRRGLAPVRDAR